MSRAGGRLFQQELRTTSHRLGQHGSFPCYAQLNLAASSNLARGLHMKSWSTSPTYTQRASERSVSPSIRRYSRLPISGRGSRVGRARTAQQSSAAHRGAADQQPDEAPSDAHLHATPARPDAEERGSPHSLTRVAAPTEPAVPLPPDPDGVLSQETHPAVATMLGQEAVICTREVEWMNIMVGYEQANRYALLNPSGQPLGYLIEQEGSFGKAMTRQFLRTHRPFKALVLAPDGTPILRVERSLTLINSRTRVYAIDPDAFANAASAGLDGAAGGEGEELIGEVRQVWHPFKRRYEIFKARDGGQEMQQFAKVDGAFLTWDFFLEDENGRPVGSVNRNFRGFAKEIFADVGQYVVRFQGDTPASSSPTNDAKGTRANEDTRELVPITPSLTLDERALALCGLAFGLDVDYFSRHSSTGAGGFFPWFMPIPMGGGGSGAQAPDQAPAEVSGPTSGTEVWQDTRGVQAPPGMTGGDSAVGAAGTMAGYEAWSGWSGRSGESPSHSAEVPAGREPPAPPGHDYTGSGQGDMGSSEELGTGEEVWGDDDPWSGADGGDSGGGGDFGDMGGFF